jgi:hypothetical protein
MRCEVDREAAVVLNFHRPWSGFEVSPRNVGAYDRVVPEHLAACMREILAKDAREVESLLGKRVVWP